VSDDADFTPNRDRAIWIEGKFTEAMLDRLRPRILEFTAQSRQPITVFVNGSGGRPDVAETILKLLRETTQDDARASRIITVGCSRVCSMAANFLSAGDFAIASPGCKLLYHGARWAPHDLTGEWASEWVSMARALPTFHEMHAAALARRSVHRFLYVVSSYRETFAQERANASDPSLTDLDCLQAILRGKLSQAGQTVLQRAIPLWESYNGLLLQFQKRMRRGRSVSKARLRRLMFHASAAFEWERNQDAGVWDGGLGRISDHFHFLNAYFDFEKLGEWVAARSEPQAGDTDAEAAYFLQFRLFFLALCRALQEGENELTAVDAVHLGLIDSIRDLASP